MNNTDLKNIKEEVGDLIKSYNLNDFLELANLVTNLKNLFDNYKENVANLQAQDKEIFDLVFKHRNSYSIQDWSTIIKKLRIWSKQ